MGIRPFRLSILLAPLMALVLVSGASAAQLAPATPTLDPRLFKQLPTQPIQPRPDLRIQRSLVLRALTSTRIQAGGSVDFSAEIQPGINTKALYYYSVGGRVEPQPPHGRGYRKTFPYPGQYGVSVKANLGPDGGELYSNQVTVTVDPKPQIRYSLTLRADVKPPLYTGDPVPLVARIRPDDRGQALYSFLVDGRPELTNVRQNRYQKRFDRAGTYTLSATANRGPDTQILTSNAIRLVVNERPPAVRYSLYLRADRQRGVVGEEVTFTADLQPGSRTGANYSFLIDGRPEPSNPRLNVYRKRFDRAGTYRVTATAFPGSEASPPSSNAVTVVIDPPVRYSLSLSANPQQILAGDSTRLEASLRPDSGTGQTFTFLIDGRPDLRDTPRSVYWKRFDRPGSYTATVTTPDPNQRSVLTSNRVPIRVDPRPSPPRVSLQAIIEPSTLTAPWGEIVRFRSASRVPADMRPSYLWNGPDDLRGEDAVFEIDTGRHAPREYPIGLTLSAPGERPARATGRLIVSAPRLALTADRNEADPGEAIRFDLKVPSGRTNQQYVLYFGDDNAESLPGSGRITHAYAAEGVYQVLASTWIHGQAVESNRLRIRVPRSAPLVPPSPPVKVPPEPTPLSPWAWILPIVSLVAGIALYRFTRPPVTAAPSIQVLAVPDAEPAIDLGRRDTNGPRIELILVGDTGEQAWETETATEEPRNG